MSIRALGKQSLIYGIGHMMARLITFLLLPLYTHSFTQEEYGALSLSYAFMGFSLILYLYGMDTSLMKFSVQTKGKERTTYITTIILSQLFTGCVFTFLLYGFRNYSAIWVLGIDRPDWMAFLSIILHVILILRYGVYTKITLNNILITYTFSCFFNTWFEL